LAQVASGPAHLGPISWPAGWLAGRPAGRSVGGRDRSSGELRAGVTLPPANQAARALHSAGAQSARARDKPNTSGQPSQTTMAPGRPD